MTGRFIPKKGVFEATLGCNLRCLHCGSSAGIPREDELTTAECADLFAQLAALGMEWLTISGGEPMTRPDWAELIALCAKTGIRTGMITNAVALDLDAALLAKRNGLSGIGFSVDGLPPTHDRVRGRIGHFQRLMDAMDHCAEAHLPFSVVTTLNNDNLNELDGLYDILVTKGAYAWQVQLGSDMGNMRHHPQLLVSPRRMPELEQRVARLIRRGALRVYPGDSLGYFGPLEKVLRTWTGGACFGGCGAGIRNIGIESNGNVKGCLSILPGNNEEGDRWVEGNIRQTSLAEIWHRPGAFAYNREWTPASLSGACGDCRFAQRCKGGCMGKRVSDGSEGENHYCSTRELALRALEKRRTGVAAAAVVAGFAVAAGGGCDTVDDPDPRPQDSDTSDTASEVDTSDTSSDPVVMYGVPEYGIWETDTFNVDEYGIMDTETMDVSLYAIIPDTDTTAVDVYGIPIYNMAPPDEEK